LVETEELWTERSGKFLGVPIEKIPHVQIDWNDGNQQATRSSTRLARIWKRLLKAAVGVIKFLDEMSASWGLELPNQSQVEEAAIPDGSH
jgi:hypothetical protein